MTCLDFSRTDLDFPISIGEIVQIYLALLYQEGKPRLFRKLLTFWFLLFFKADYVVETTREFTECSLGLLEKRLAWYKVSRLVFFSEKESKIQGIVSKEKLNVISDLEEEENAIVERKLEEPSDQDKGNLKKVPNFFFLIF